MPRTKSPLRYPGGKTQLANFVFNTIKINDIKNCVYIEPYAGGFGAGLELLLSNRVSEVVINDYDKSIYSVWYSIINNTEKLIDLIEKTPITMDSWYKQKELHNQNKNYRNSLENGFSTLFLNRTNRSGIISAGPIGGYSQLGEYKLDCRFNKKDLIKKIIDISEQKERIHLYQLDAVKLIDTIKKEYDSKSSFIFFDPPYFVQGKKLYTNFYNEKDHRILAGKIAELEDYYWITTYDHAPPILDMYTNFNNRAFTYSLLYSAQTKRKAIEYIFASPKTELESQDKIKLDLILK
ncbi:DNA adenine methylase [Enterococcus faecalis]|uniref:DNA adenine methylase n=1 Tax=Enterococcus faecalis TaxID=1351 RepID=UPI0031CD12C2